MLANIVSLGGGWGNLAEQIWFGAQTWLGAGVWRHLFSFLIWVLSGCSHVQGPTCCEKQRTGQGLLPWSCFPVTDTESCNRKRKHSSAAWQDRDVDVTAWCGWAQSFPGYCQHFKRVMKCRQCSKDEECCREHTVESHRDSVGAYQNVWDVLVCLLRGETPGFLQSSRDGAVSSPG